ncbi:MAG TPA: ATP-binding protein, partial [Thermoanaerobaculia bacterium]
LGEGLLAVNAKGRVVFANARFAEMFGRETAVAGRSVVEVARKHGVISAVEAALRGEAIVTRVSTNVGDVERQIEIRAVPVKSSSEIAAIALFIDITDLARLERIRRDFLQDFSHEVRTPLAGLRVAAETFEGGQLTAEHEHALRQVIRRQIQRLERLVDDISELTRIESGDLVLEKRSVDLREIASDVCEDFRERTNQVGSISIAGSSAVVVADPVRLQQVMSNLIDNAAKHGGTEVRVEIATDGGEGVIRVVDNGNGIPAGELDRIFNRFYRVDRSRSQAVPGLGLGLAITKHLVLLHGGTVRAYNRSEGGAVFEVRIPKE